MPRLSKYLRRRVTRLEPPYIVAMTAIAVLLIVLKHQERRDVLRHLGASLVYAHGLLFGAKSTIAFIAWSLEIEVQFYLLMPLIAHVYRVRSCFARRIVLAGTAFMFVVLQRVAFTHLPEDVQIRLALSLAGHIQYFLGGMYLADVYATGGESFGSQSGKWDCVSAVGWPALTAIWYWSTAATAVLFPILVVLLYIAAFRGPVTNRVMKSPWLCAIGGMCYSIYLLHMPLISLMGPLCARLLWAPSLPLTLAIQITVLGLPILIASGVFFLIIERPCMRKRWPQELVSQLLRRFRDQRTASARISGDV